MKFVGPFFILSVSNWTFTHSKKFSVYMFSHTGGVIMILLGRWFEWYEFAGGMSMM